MKNITIRTVWRTASEQCELVFFGKVESRLRLWVRGALVVDELIIDIADALRRAAELRLERQRAH